MTIRPAVTGDAESIAALTTQLGYPTLEAEIAARMGALAAAGKTAILVAESDGAVIGWVGVRSDLALESGSYAEIVGLVVDEAHRGARIGAALVKAAESWARERGHGRIRVRSNVIRERAHGFYRRLGYEVEKRQVVFDKRFS